MGLSYHSFLFSGRPEFGAHTLGLPASWRVRNWARKGLFMRLLWLIVFRAFTWIRGEKKIAQGGFVEAVLALFG